MCIRDRLKRWKTWDFNLLELYLERIKRGENIAHQCKMCGKYTIFYIWTTSRHFPIRKFLEKIPKKEKLSIKRQLPEGLPVCFKCYEELRHS